MTSLDPHRYTFWSTSLMSLIHFVSSRHLERSSLVFLSSVYALIMVGNMWIIPSNIFALSMVYFITSQFPIPLSRTGLQRERTELYRMCPIVWYSLELWVLHFGLKLSIVPTISRIRCLTRHCDIWLVRRLGLMSSLMFLHFMFLVVRLGLLF